MDQMHGQTPLFAAERIIGELVVLREKIKATAEGFAILDFVQGHVVTELPADTARDIVHVLRGEESGRGRTYLNDLVMLWLENYRRASSNMIMRVLENDSDSLTA